MNEKSKNLGAFLVPLSIVLAGIMVSGAIFAATKKDETAGTTDDQPVVDDTSDTTEQDPKDVSFYYREDAEIYMEEGKPVVALISTTSCPHCTWVAETFDNIAKEYEAAGKIKAYHFELSQSGAYDTLTGQESSEMPEKLSQLNTEYSGGYVPTFIIGGKYYRIGNAFEREDDLEKEAAELRRIIDKVIEETK